jgi:hypothetical protein
MAEGVVPEDREEDGVTEEEEDSVYIGNIITGTQYAVFYIEVTLIILNTKVCTTQYKQTRRYQGPGPGTAVLVPVGSYRGEERFRFLICQFQKICKLTTFSELSELGNLYID